MTTTDPLALWRSAEQFSLAEAACLIHSVPPSRTYPTQRDGLTQAMRDEQGLVGDTLKMLKADARALGVVVRHVPSKTVIGYNEITRASHVHRSVQAHDEFGRVARAAVVAWCELKEMRSPFFFPEQTAASSNGGEKPIGALERDTLLSLIAVLCEAAGIDLRAESKMHAEAARIVVWGGARKLATSSETIAKKLVEARTRISPKGPVTPLDVQPNSNSNQRRSKSKD